MFIGPCNLHKFIKKTTNPPPAFFKFVRSIEISLSPDFSARAPARWPTLVMCNNAGLDLKEPHDPWDFHWLRLDKFEKLQSLKMWIAARSIYIGGSPNPDFLGVLQLDRDALTRRLSAFSHLKSFTMSTPLGRHVGSSEDGLVEEISRPGFQVFKRGSGDRYHPFLNPPPVRHALGGMNPQYIRTFEERSVHPSARISREEKLRHVNRQVHLGLDMIGFERMKEAT
jgi:hypothetical protein